MNLIKQIKLPSSLRNNKTAITIMDYVSSLGPKSSFFSTLLYRSGDKCHFLKKDEQFPFIPFDWSIYTMLRVSSKTMITSGMNLRKQASLFDHNVGTYGTEELMLLFKENVVTPINLVVFTKSMSNQEIEDKISKVYFKHLPLTNFGKDLELKELANQINKLEMGPTLLENGETTLSSALMQVKENQTNFIQMIILSLLEGAIPHRYISKEYNMSIINRDFQKVWESDPESSSVLQEDGTYKPIGLNFAVYIRK